VPNRDFIATHVLNWTLSDNVIRLFLTVGIAYGSDVEKALRLIEGAGFSIERLDFFVADDTPAIFGTLYRGAARP